MWAGSQVKLQKHTREHADTLQLFESLLDQLSASEFELFLAQTWLIWDQRNTIIYGGKLKELNWLNKRAVEFLNEFQQAQDQLAILATQASVTVWQPPPTSIFKLNFDAVVFAKLKCSGFGAIIRNEKDEVMAAMSIKGPPVAYIEEAEVLACRKALEFSIDAGFMDLIIEGDNVNVMRSISSQVPCHSLLGGVYGDVLCLIHGLHRKAISCVKQEANIVAHSLARFARNVHDELYWMEESPPHRLYMLCTMTFYLVNE